MYIVLDFKTHEPFLIQYAPFSFTNHPSPTPVAVLCITKSGQRSKSTIKHATLVTRCAHGIPYSQAALGPEHGCADRAAAGGLESQ